MPAPTRVTIALDSETAKLFEEMKAESRLSQSGLIRKALQFYSKNKKLIDRHGTKQINTYVDMLADGEHIILDIDHFIMFLKLIESSPEGAAFWENHKKVAESHSEHLGEKVKRPVDFLERLEACNFFKLSKTSDTEFTLILYSDVTKKFVTTLIEDVLRGMGFKVEIKEDLAKLRLKVLN
ncbi:MAG TPA: CopG family transcriptional regulator [Euryarchaeota archaeon]|nr:ribbon-helix-helix protein, copG family [archaeon BMS3Abin16]GBE55877.1 ribbon-helix-helix protein, copG family [archaeon BMS3Bbin16]HDH28271.1 CopG family transcriptional regulator [Euryarchaeota archaeon]